MPRDADQRVVGTCRHFAVLSCALLRYRGIPARARCGFATYFQKGQGLDHWVTEYWDEAQIKRGCASTRRSLAYSSCPTPRSWSPVSSFLEERRGPLTE